MKKDKENKESKGEKLLQVVDGTTYKVVNETEPIEAVVGDEKQKVFLPRVKIKKWNNEVNLSVGTTQTEGEKTVKEDKISYETEKEISHFYPLKPEKPEFDKTGIRLLKLDAISPERIGSIYELDREVFWSRQTIVTHHCDRYAMMYFGFYPADSYIDGSKIDIPEMRISSYPLQNDPMVMDESLKLVDIHYNPLRDDLEKIHASTKQAIAKVLKKYDIEVTGEDRKLYFKDGDKTVKFFSTAFIGGHYYYYINLGLDYQEAHKYFRDDVPPPTKDEEAYGIRAIQPDLPENIVDDILVEYAKLYDLKLEDDAFTDEERELLEKLDEVHRDEQWVVNAKRDIFDLTAKGFDEIGDGFEFEIELKEKPETNIVVLTVETKGLNFHYQAELNFDEARSSYRPQNIIGSFAAYHESKEGEGFQTGKAFHINRPWAIDKTGKKVWCSFDANWDGKGDLNITVPQDFLDSAEYPVIIDPTFGYTTIGASGDGSEGILALPATSTAGSLKSISFSGIGSNSGKVAIYDGNTKVADSVEVNYAKNGWGTLAVTATLLAQSYNLSYWQDAGGYNVINYDTVTNAGKVDSTTYVAGNNNFPSTVSFTTNNKKYSIYANYKTGTSGINTWDGTNWVMKPVKVWSGSAWVEKPLKRWDGSSWVNSDS